MTTIERPQLFDLLRGKRHQFGLLLLYRGDTFIETVEPGNFAVFVFFTGDVTITRKTAGEQVGLHISPANGLPLTFRAPGTYCVVAKNHSTGARLIRTGEPE